MATGYSWSRCRGPCLKPRQATSSPEPSPHRVLKNGVPKAEFPVPLDVSPWVLVGRGSEGTAGKDPGRDIPRNGPAGASAPFQGRCLTLSDPDRIIESMSGSNSQADLEQELKQLERRLDELVALSTRLQEENRALRQRQDAMMAERATLLQKNEQVRARVEAMIGRLKAMEHSA